MVERAAFNELVRLTEPQRRSCLENMRAWLGPDAYSSIASFAPRTCMIEPLLQQGLAIVHKQIMTSFTTHGSKHWLHCAKSSKAMGTDTAIGVADAIRSQLSPDVIYSLFMLASFNVKQVLDPWEDAAGDLERYDTDPWEDAAGDLERYDTPLHAAVLFRDIDSIRLLLCFRVDVDGYQAYDSPYVVVTPLFEAVRTRYTDALVLLLEARADANKFGIDHDVSRMGFGMGHLVEEVPHAYAITSLWYAASRIIEHPLIYSNQHVALLMKFQADPRQPGKFEYRLSDDAESDASDAREDRFVEALDSGTSPLDIARQACLERSCQQTQALLCLLGRGSDDASETPHA